MTISNPFKKINLMPQDTYNNLLEVKSDELYAIETPVIVEVSDKSLLPSWYVIYSNGWCEQGGRLSVSTSTTTITLLKSYIDTNYNISMTGSVGYPWVTSRTVNSFVADTSANATVDWKTKGYIK